MAGYKPKIMWLIIIEAIIAVMPHIIILFLVVSIVILD